MSKPAKPEKRVRLRFGKHGGVSGIDEPMRRDLSACALIGSTLWTASDEATSVERLITRDGDTFEEHVSFDLVSFFDFPAGPDNEIDIEGLDVDDGYLWIVGSHGLTRKKPARHETDAEAALERLTVIKRDPNRFFFGRVPLVPEGHPEDGIWRPVQHPDGGSDGCREAACIKMKNGGSALSRAVAEDEQLAPFLGVPCKENGFDVEGLAVRGRRVYLGLRGPVLRGWALILELRVVRGKSGRLKLEKIGPNGARFRKHFLDLDGLGIRELARFDDDLLILAGPTMDLDGPVALYRWPGALEIDQPDVVPHDRLKHLLDLPVGDGVDHPEGIALLAVEDDAQRLLIVNDSPAEDRLYGDGTSIDADVFAVSHRQFKNA
ncbi:MAG: DUF3616 domain-containing protein [Rhodospirillales bacterium]|nr:DUF3616 domain-containing protein [Rhodospirillales bacterium]